MLTDSNLSQTYRSLVENTPDLVSWHKVDGEFLYAAPSVTPLLGYTPDDLVGRSIFELLHRQDIEALSKAYSALRRQKSEVAVEYRLRHANGDHVWFKSTLKPVLDEPHPVAEIYSYAQNISALKKTEAALQILSRHDDLLHSNEWFRILVSHLTTAFKVDYAFITELSDTGTHVQMLAFWKGSDFGNPFMYPLTHTPCDGVINEGKVCYYPVSVQALFPADKDLVDLDAQGYLGLPVFNLERKVIGHLAILDRKPLKVSDAELALAKLFATRAGMELERLHRQQNGSNGAH